MVDAEPPPMDSTMTSSPEQTLPMMSDETVKELKFLRQETEKYTEKYARMLEEKVKKLEARLEACKDAANEASSSLPRQRDSSTFSHGKENEDESGPEATINDEEKKQDRDNTSPRFKLIYKEQKEGRWVDISEKELEKTEQIKTEDSSSDFAFKYSIYRDPESEEAPGLQLGNGLRSLLSKLLLHFPDHSLDSEESWYDSPFPMLILNWDLLESAVSKGIDNEEEQRELEDLRSLMKIISTKSGDSKLDAYFRSRETNLKNGKITYDAIWTLFPPGEMVLSRPFLDQDQVFIVSDGYRFGWPITEKRDRRKPPPWILICWSYDWDGSTFERKPFEFSIEPFSGTKPINSLKVFPVKYLDGTAENQEWENILRPELIKRGKKFRDLCTAPRGSRLHEYNGLALARGRGISAQATPDEEPTFAQDLRSTSSDHWDEYSAQETLSSKKSQVKGTVMVDFGAYYQHASAAVPLGSLLPSVRETECQCSACHKNEVLRRTLKFDYDAVEASVPPERWEADQFLICPPRVMGYSMRNSHWAQLQVRLIEPATVEDTFDKKLSLNENTKKIIKDLVVNHEKGKRGQGKSLDDLVEDKGKGLVLLFHGPPGVGKTLTAESVAKSTGKPLFSIGVSDIGVDSRLAERNLRRYFNLATEWEAVMLIDEADVFLSSRGQGETNLEKNALVSVLLRVLEYYEGILILTTNRINSFDVAVQSRVHLAVKYQNFDDKQTSAIYTIFLTQVRDDDFIHDWTDIQAWIKNESRRSKFNGRQIRNIVSAALGLARAEGKKLNREHLDEIAERTAKFHEELGAQRSAYEAKQLAMSRGGYGEG